MINGKNIVAVIPARGGSKGLKNKNIRNLLGKPLIYYTIKTALESKLIDRVIVSTDSEKIARVAKRCGAEVPFKRPAKLATDTAHTPPVIQHAIRFLERREHYHTDIVITMEPTSPIRNVEDIDKMLRLFAENKYDSLISVKDVGCNHPWRILKIKGNKLIPFLKLKVDPFNLERQQFPPAFIDQGSAFITKTEALFRKNNVIVIENCGAYVMTDERYSVEIDNYTDLLFAELVMKEMLKNGKKDNTIKKRN